MHQSKEDIMQKPKKEGVKPLKTWMKKFKLKAKN